MIKIHLKTCGLKPTFVTKMSKINKGGKGVQLPTKSPKFLCPNSTNSGQSPSILHFFLTASLKNHRVGHERKDRQRTFWLNKNFNKQPMIFLIFLEWDCFHAKLR